MDRAKIINTYIESSEMREYLIACLSDLSDRQLADIICGGRKPLKQKYADLKLLAEISNDEYITEAYKEAQEALDGFEINHGEVFLLTESGYDEEILQEKIYGSAPAFSFKQTSGIIDEDWDDCTEEENENRTDWYEFEKYVPDGKKLKWTSRYTIAPNSDIWFYHHTENNGIRSYLSAQGLNLYLAIPFEIGDILTIDCRPFRPVKHAVLLEKGNNCCTVTCAWISNESYIRVGSLMHNSLFDDSPIDMSSLYRLEKFNGKLCLYERPLADISKAIKGKAQKGEKLWKFIVHNENMDYQKLCEWIEGHKND